MIGKHPVTGTQNFNRSRFSGIHPLTPSSVRTEYTQPPGCRSPSSTLKVTPGRITGPGLAPAGSKESGIVSAGAVGLPIAVTFCPSANIGEGTAVAGGVGAVAGAAMEGEV